MFGLAKTLGRALRYEPMPELLGIEVAVSGPETAAQDVARAIEERLDFEVELEGPPLRFLTGAAIKYGLLDLDYRVRDLAAESVRFGGVPVLRELGFAGGCDAPDEPWEEGEEGCDLAGDGSVLQMLVEEVSEGRVFLRVLLKEPSSTQDVDRLRWLVKGPPEDFWPRTFRVDDACLTNAPSVWFLKHLYL